MMHYIQFTSDKEYERAIGVWRNVCGKRAIFPGDRMMVTDEHIRALEAAKIKFKWLSQDTRNHVTATTA